MTRRLDTREILQGELMAKLPWIREGVYRQGVVGSRGVLDFAKTRALVYLVVTSWLAIWPSLGGPKVLAEYGLNSLGELNCPCNTG